MPDNETTPAKKATAKKAAKKVPAPKPKTFWRAFEEKTTGEGKDLAVELVNPTRSDNLFKDKAAAEAAIADGGNGAFPKQRATGREEVGRDEDDAPIYEGVYEDIVYSAHEVDADGEIL